MSGHLRGIMIAGALAALALGLGFMTLVMNQTASKAEPHVIIPLKDRHHVARTVAARKPAPAVKALHHTAGTTARKPAPAAKPKKKVAVKRPDSNFVAALHAGLPRPVALALAKRAVVVVELWSSADAVGKLSAAEAQAGAALGGAGFVGVNVDHDGGAVSVLTTALGKLPDVPAALIYTRPGKLTFTLAGFADRTMVQQAAADAGSEQAAAAAPTS